MFPPKPLDVFSPEGGCSEGLDVFKCFLNPTAILLCQINHHAGTPRHNNYKRHDKLGYSSACYVGSRIADGVHNLLVYSTTIP